MAARLSVPSPTARRFGTGFGARPCFCHSVRQSISAAGSKGWLREHMPTLFRFLTVVGGSAALLYGSMYMLATAFEPEPQPVVKKIPNIRVNR